MKLRLLTALFFFSAAANAQQWRLPKGQNAHTIPYSKNMIPYIRRPYIHVPFDGIMQKDTLIHSERYVINGKLEPGIHYAPLDNMAFLVPDPKVSVSMPNAWADVKVPYTGGHMPNPALPENDEKSRMKK